MVQLVSTHILGIYQTAYLFSQFGTAEVSRVGEAPVGRHEGRRAEGLSLQMSHVPPQVVEHPEIGKKKSTHS